jgi:hypothetical protein
MNDFIGTTVEASVDLVMYSRVRGIITEVNGNQVTIQSKFLKSRADKFWEYEPIPVLINVCFSEIRY